MIGAKLRSLCKSFFRRSDREQELSDELQFHLEARAEDLIAREGLSPENALRRARIEFGSVEKYKEEVRQSLGLRLIDEFRMDLRYAFRTLRCNKVFAVAAVLMVALGIGANTAVFSIVNGILFRPLPYRNPDRLVVVQEMIPELDKTPRAVNPLHFLEWQRECNSFEDIALSEYVSNVNVTGQGDPERIPSLRVTHNAFSVMGISAQIGRTFVPEEGQPGRDTVVVISDGLWRRRFGADPNIIGKTIHLDGSPSAIVGVLPPGFRHDWGPTDARKNDHIDIYRPWVLAPTPPWWSWTNWFTFTALGRLRESVSLQSALNELNGIQSAIAKDHFEGKYSSVHLRAMVVPFHEWVTGESREGLFLLLAAVGAALLVACLNIANLMLMRATARSREAGVRVALGASRIRIFRGAFIESAVLAFAGAAAGVVLAWGFLKFFASIAPAHLPRVNEVQIDWIVLLIALGLAMSATLAFGLTPALWMTRVHPQEALHTNNRAFTDSAGRLRFRSVLISVEVGLSTCLLIIAGLLLASFSHVDDVDRGFDSWNVLTAEVSLPPLSYRDDNARLRFYELLLERLRSEPGVINAGVTNKLPLRGPDWGGTAVPAGEESRPVEKWPNFQYRFVSAGYLEAMGIPLLAGRALVPGDYPRHVAVLSKRAARLLWPQGNPIGMRFRRGDPKGNSYEVVGLVPDVHTDDLAAEPEANVYLPLTATGGIIYLTNSIAVRVQGHPSTAAAVLRNAVASLDRQLPISKVQMMQQIESAALGDRRFQLILIGAFAVASLFVAAIGTYSVLAYAIARRTPELALRMALGARRTSVMAMVLRNGIRPVLLGLGIGVAGALALGRLLSSFLFSVEPTDVSTFAIVIALTLVAAILACWIPARRAARTSLLDALRYE